MQFIEQIFAKLRRHPKRIVFPEGEDPSVIAGARRFYEQGTGVPVLLGKRKIIERVANSDNIPLDHVAIIDPETSADFGVFCERLEKLDRYRKMGVRDAKAIMANPNYFGAMMLQYGLVDGMVGGVSSYSGALFRPLIQLVKPLPHARVVAGCMIVEIPDPNGGESKVLFFADCGVVPKPDLEQLAGIAVETGLLARQVFGRRPRIALLSYSTKGSARSPETEQIARAAELARELCDSLDADIAVDGELQADAALSPEIAAIKTGPSLVAGKANVLIFPDLNSGNIACKLMQYLAGARVYGQMIIGLTRPAVEVARGSSPEHIATVAAIAGLQSVEYRSLYPEQTAD